MPSQISFADAARVYARKLLTNMKAFPLPAEITPLQAIYIQQAVVWGCDAARMMTTSPEEYAKIAAQRCRDSFDVLKRLAIRDAKVWELMEECYQFGWEWFMQSYERVRQRSASRRSLEAR
jgi:hypothetical protein